MPWPINPEPFYVQEYDRGPWHVETPDNPERMLCGIEISVESTSAKVQKRFGVKPCLWCKHWLEEKLSSLQAPPSARSSSPLNPKTTRT